MGKVEVTTSVTKEFPVDRLVITYLYSTQYGDDINSKDKAFALHRGSLVGFKEELKDLTNFEYLVGSTKLREQIVRKEVEKTNRTGFKSTEKTTETEQKVIGYLVYTDVTLDITEIDKDKVTELMAFLNKSSNVDKIDIQGYLNNYESAKDEVRQELCAKAKKQAQDLVLPLCKEIKGVNLIRYNTSDSNKAFRQANYVTEDSCYMRSLPQEDITFAEDIINTTLDTPIRIKDSVFVEFEVQ